MAVFHYHLYLPLLGWQKKNYILSSFGVRLCGVLLCGAPAVIFPGKKILLSSLFRKNLLSFFG
jgi:hypothetical protein